MKNNSIFFLCTLCSIGYLALSVYSETKAPGKIIINGGSMELKNNGTTTIFRDGVKLKRDNSIATADEMIYDKNAGTVTMSGTIMVRFRSAENETVYAKGERGIYNEQKHTGSLFGNPQIIRTAPDATGQINVYAKEIYFNDETEEVTASKNVYIIQHQTEARSDTAHMIYPKNTIILSGGKPYIKRIDQESMGEYYGDEITILYKNKKAILKGNVHGWIRLAEKNE